MTARYQAKSTTGMHVGLYLTRIHTHTHTSVLGINVSSARRTIHTYSAYIHAYIHAHIHPYIHEHTHTHTHTQHTHTHTHTHTHCRMFYVDRRRSNARASAHQIHRQMNSVKKLADEWKPLLVGAGGGSGPGAFDDPYFWCYDQVCVCVCVMYTYFRCIYALYISVCVLYVYMYRVIYVL